MIALIILYQMANLILDVQNSEYFFLCSVQKVQLQTRW